MHWKEHPWAGVFPATMCPFHEDESLDEQGLRRPGLSIRSYLGGNGR
jgi:dihydrodipicolinate synthase/N-acetylneuraminate lyase